MDSNNNQSPNFIRPTKSEVEALFGMKFEDYMNEIESDLNGMNEVQKEYCVRFLTCDYF